MKVSNEVKVAIGLLVADVLVAILVLFIPRWLHAELPLSDDILFAMWAFVALVLIEIYYYVARIAEQEKREEERWILRESCDQDLQNIRNSLYRIIGDSYGRRDLFVSHLMTRVRDLADKIIHVAERRELHVRADHFLNVENVLDAFQGSNERVWRYTWSIAAVGKLFDDHAWKSYFDRTSRMVEAGHIKEIRTILVLEELRLVESSRVKKLLDFFHTNNGFNCTIIGLKDYRSICAKNGVSDEYIDFGIYGDRLLFLTERYDPEIEGLFTKDPARIQHVTNLFDSMWSSRGAVQPNPSTEWRRVSLEQLYAFDDAEQE